MKKIIINSLVLEKMKKLTEKYKKTENGGLIYGRMNPKWIQILDVSDAGDNAKRSLTRIEFEQEYITEYTKKKVELEQFVVGTWHSHPPCNSLNPSSIDYSTMKEIANYYVEPYNPIFFITKMERNVFIFSIYGLDKEKNIYTIKEYKLIESEE